MVSNVRIRDGLPGLFALSVIMLVFLVSAKVFGQESQLDVARKAVTRDRLLEDLEQKERKNKVKITGVKFTDCRLGADALLALQSHPSVRAMTLVSCELDGQALSGLHNLRSIVCDDCKISGSLLGLCNLPDLRELALVNMDLQCMHWDFMSCLKTLEVLSIENSRVEDLPLSKVVHPEKITRLDLSGIRIASGQIVHLGRFSNLQELDLKNCECSAEMLLTLARFQQIKLIEFDPAKDADNWFRFYSKQFGGRETESVRAETRELDFANTSLSDRGLDGLAEDLPVVLFNAKNTHLTASGLRKLCHMPALENLTLTQTAMTDKGLNSLKHLRKLKILDIARCGISGEGLNSLSTLLNLDASGNRLSKTGLADISRIPRLTVLKLDECQLPSSGIKTFSSRSVCSLSLTNCRISARDVRYCKDLPSLKELSISGVSLDREMLSEVGSLQQLVRLDVTNCRGLSGNGYLEIGKLKNLAELRTRGSDLNQEDLYKLRRLLPVTRLKP